MIPEIIPLWSHQKEALRRALLQTEFALFMEMGTGKTAATINIIRNKCFEQKRLLRTLIICPVVVCENWYREIGTHSKVQEHTTVLKGAGKKRVELFRKAEKKAGHIFITNYEGLQMKDLFHELHAWAPEIVVVDESQRIKNYKSLRTKLVTQLGDRADYRYILSGTPIINNPMDIFGQYRFLDGGATFEKNFFAFRVKYFYDKNAGMPSNKYFPDWRPRPGVEAAFNALIYRKAIRVLKKDCLDLPPVVRKLVTVDLTSAQDKMYQSMRKHFIAYLDDKACVATIALTKALRLQQIVSGFFVDDEGVTHTYEDIPRLAALKEYIEMITPNAKVIIWCCFQENYKSITAMLDGMTLDLSSSDDNTSSALKYTMLIGGMTEKQRQESIDRFQTDGDCRVMVANQQAGGVGVNLTAASYMIYFSRSFSLEADLQSEARCHRGGSEIHDKITRIDLVAPNTIDALILEALQKKESLAENILRLRDKL